MSQQYFGPPVVYKCEDSFIDEDVNMTDIAERLRAEIERTVDLDLLHHDAANELDRLRAEYASLQESVTAKDLLIASLKEENERLKGPRPMHESARARINDLTQQLAAANGRVEKMREIVRMFVGCRVIVSTQINPRGHDWCEAYLDQLLPIAEVALTALPQQVKSEDARDTARYWWLRDGNAFFPEEEMIRGGDDLDRAIDAAISAQEEKA